MRRCGNCGMYGNNKLVKYKIGESPLTEKIYAFLCCKHCNDTDKLLCIQYSGKKEMKNRDDIEELDHWEVKVAPQITTKVKSN